MPPRNDFDKLVDVVQQQVENLASKRIEKILLKLQEKANALQDKFFKYLTTSAGVFGGNAAPTFAGISLSQPKWDPLSPEYSKRKTGSGLTYFKAGGAGKVKARSDRFFINKGNLQRYFARISPQNKLGVPEVSFVQKGTRGSRAVSTAFKSGTGVRLNIFDKSGQKLSQFKPSRGNIGTVVIDLFPKIPGPLPPVLTFQALQDLGFPKDVAMKLTRRDGKISRPFMSQYMQWWVRTKGKEITKGVI